MTRKQLKNDIISKLENNEVLVNNVKIVGFNKDENTIKCLEISISCTGNDELYKCKNVIDELGIEVLKRIVEF